MATRLADLLAHRSEPGPGDALTDLVGVGVGHVDVRSGPADQPAVFSTLDDETGTSASESAIECGESGVPSVVTGVTAIRFTQLETGRSTLPAGLFCGNAYGKLIGATQLMELGAIETPIVLTNTLSAFAAADALVGWLLERPEHARTRSINPLVGECNDGWLSDIRQRPVRAEHVREALVRAGDPGRRPATGAVGAGSGMVTMGYKGGIGTASRTAEVAGCRFTVGALSLSNFGGSLRVGARDLPAEQVLADAARPPEDGPARQRGNSCVTVLVTDAPVDARQLSRLAKRAVFAMGRVGASFSHGSGDYGIAVGVGEPALPVDEDQLDPLLTAALEASEAALVDSVLSATTTTGQLGRTAYGFPHADLER